ncbi:chemotaxis protein CheW [Pleurocapsales cyanobacterium LEGE 06147]|nr:chemotaxis protein CheW [Pleurocapsales cyanobacterium LEGE 06147]
MNVSEISQHSPISSGLTEERFILVALNELTFVFPATLIAEILIIERSKILNLPFYSQAVLGCVHHVGKIIPLVSLRHVVNGSGNITGENAIVVLLNPMAGELAGVGIVIDKVLGSSFRDRLPPNLFDTDCSFNSASTDTKIRLFQPETIASHTWQLQRW